MKKIFLSLLVAGFATLVNAQPPAGDANIGEWYGEQISAEGAMNVNDVAKKLKGGAPTFENVKIEAKVTDVCAKKGCWLTLELNNGETAMVKMKDYGFFLPVAAKGKTIVIEGDVSMKTISVAEQKHYAEDAKKTQTEIDAITEPKKEIKVLAKGIVVVK